MGWISGDGFAGAFWDVSHGGADLAKIWSRRGTHHVGTAPFHIAQWVLGTALESRVPPARARVDLPSAARAVGTWGRGVSGVRCFRTDSRPGDLVAGPRRIWAADSLFPAARRGRFC